MKPIRLSLILLFGGVAAHAQLAVTVSPANVTGNKTVVKLELKNGFSEKVESARAVCFLLDEKSKVAGQSTQWVIGGTKKKLPLAPGATNTFHFVIPNERISSTNRPLRSSSFWTAQWVRVMRFLNCQ